MLHTRKNQHNLHFGRTNADNKQLLCPFLQPRPHKHAKGYSSNEIRTCTFALYPLTEAALFVFVSFREVHMMD